ncbi:MAG: pyridoxal-phosphate dependent enzyme [Patescibacteria group bacterium]|nr:pyridoxal-phosphate dependent enzyme [Patescibacteria group bacterium]
MENNNNFFRGENSILDFINPENYYTPLIELPSKINPYKKDNINIFIKLSWFNPLLNIKLIPAYWMIKEAKKDGFINKGYNLIEASSGNMAYSIQILSKFFGVKKFIALVSEQVSEGKKKVLEIFGVKYKIRKEDICPDPNDPKSSINIAKKFRNKKNWYNLGQYDNPNNYWGHYFITGKQIYEQLNRDIDLVSIGLGTTGTLIGVSKYLKEKNKNIKIIGIIRNKNNLVPGVRTLNLLKEIQFKWEDYLDEKIFVDTKSSYKWSLKLIRSGILAGPSTGFVLAGLIKYIKINYKNINLNFLEKKGYYNCVFVSPDTFLPYIDEYFEILNIKKSKNKINLISKNNYQNNIKIKINKNSIKIKSLEVLDIIKNNKFKKGDYIFIDIRNPIRFKHSHIPGSINIPYEEIISNEKNFIDRFKNKKIILICEVGIKSENLVYFLKSKYRNLKIYYLEGGISKWSIKNYPREGLVCDTLLKK